MRKGGVPVTKNMYTVAGDSPCNEALALRIQAGDKNAAERLISQNEGYLTGLARAYTPWCETEDLKQEGSLALLDTAAPTAGGSPRRKRSAPPKRRRRLILGITQLLRPHGWTKRP